MHPLIHQTCAGYRLTEWVGAGGMGEVFRAQHRETGQRAAVKVLHRPEHAARFRNEALVQASLSHPHIAALYETGLLDGRLALVMEWVEGPTLDALIRRQGRLPNDEATRIFGQLAQAVAYLHQRGITHRDLKPQNVKIQPDGGVKLLDFGIAKTASTPRFTQEGFAVGTTEYMAPEQFRGQGEARSDVWALGVMLYEMATGYLPFEAPNALLLRRRIAEAHYTDPRLLNPALSQSLLSSIAACLQATPTRRPTAAALAQPTDPGSPGTGWAAAGWMAPLRPYALAGLLLLGGGLGVARLLAPAPPVVRVRQQSQREQIRVEVVNADNDVQLIQPDGRVQTTEPFVVERSPGQPTVVTIRHRGSEQQFVIDPSVSGVYRCFFSQ